MQTLLQDLRYGARMLLKKPGFTLIGVLTLALGIGANTAIFSVVNGVLLRPLPYPGHERLLMVWGNFQTQGLTKLGLSQLEYVRLRGESKAFAQVGAFRGGIMTLTGTGEPERVATSMASANLFETLGVQLFRGRGFNPAEEEQGRNNVVILSYGFWQRRFAADPRIIGQSLTLNGQSFNVIGVLPPDCQSPNELTGGARPELWLTLGLNLAGLNRGSHNLNTIARLHDGVRPEAAQTEVSAIISRVVGENQSFYPVDGSYYNPVTELREEVVGNVRLALLVLLGAVLFVLLIACANVANLTLARGEARQKELAIRAALGASRFRLVRQLLMESVLLALVGGGCGALLAVWGVDALKTLNPGNLPRLAEVRLDGRVFGFTLLVSLLGGVLFGLVPALRAAQTDLHVGLKEGGRGSGEGIGRSRLRSGLVVTEMALALLLLAGAGLLINSFWRLQRVNPGFKSEGLLTLALAPQATAYQNPEHITALYERLFEKLQALPGVQAMAAANPLPLTGNNNTLMQIDGRPFDPNGTNLSTGFTVVTPAYFQTMGVRLLRGRQFNDGDQESALPVAVISEALARAQWPGAEPIGQRVRLLDAPPEQATTQYMTIVGVVADVKNQGLNAAPRQEMYVPLRQQASSGGGFRSMALVLRTATEPLGLAHTVRQTVWSVDRNIPISSVRTMEQILAAGVARQRFNATLLGVFALVALCLSTAGIYGVIAYSVSRRTHEIGIRMALGARGADVLKLVVKQGMTLALGGVALGLAASFALTRSLKTLLFGVSATDPLTFVVITLLLTFVALLACWIPARRATKVDPMVALRCE
ncbi:MAG: ABC transporter permease [Blastocatellia bacterium]